MKPFAIFGAAVVLAAVTYAGTAQRGRPRYQPSPSAVTSTAATPVSSCTGDSVSYDNNGAAGCQRTTDTAPQGVMVRAQPAFPGGTQTAAKVVLCGGQDETTYTVADYTACGTDTMTVTVVDSNGTSTANALVEATDWDATSPDGGAAAGNATTATSLAAAIDALSGVSATASAAVVSIQLDPNTCIVTTATSDTNCATTTAGTPAAVVSWRDVAVQSGGKFCFDSTCATYVFKSGSSGYASPDFQTRTFASNAGSGLNAFQASTSGARFDFGAGAADYASSDGTTVTFAGPISAAGVTSTGAVLMNTASSFTQRGGTFFTSDSPAGNPVQVSDSEGLRIAPQASVPTCTEALAGTVVPVTGSGATATKVCVCTWTPTGSVAAWVNVAANSAGTGIGNSTTCP